MMKRNIVCLALTVLLVFSLTCALASETEQSLPFATYGEAVEYAGEQAVVGGTSDYMGVIVEKDGAFFRVVAELDDKARELDEAISGAEDLDAAFDAFNAYVLTLPITQVEQFQVKPREQAELDALIGKTIGELKEAGYITTSYGSAGAEDRIGFWMSDGVFEYEFIVDCDDETYDQKNENDELDTLVVTSGTYCGPSTTALDLHVHMDGTIEVPEDPFAWLIRIGEAFEAAQNGEELDTEALIASLTEEYPELEDTIRLVVENYKTMMTMYSESDAQTEAGE